jgi:hypothetical protein
LAGEAWVLLTPLLVAVAARRLCGTPADSKRFEIARLPTA